MRCGFKVSRHLASSPCSEGPLPRRLRLTGRSLPICKLMFRAADGRTALDAQAPATRRGRALLERTPIKFQSARAGMPVRVLGAPLRLACCSAATSRCQCSRPSYGPFERLLPASGAWGALGRAGPRGRRSRWRSALCPGGLGAGVPLPLVRACMLGHGAQAMRRCAARWFARRWTWMGRSWMRTRLT